jgi:hypothetical protein
MICFKTGGKCTHESLLKLKQVFSAYPFTDNYHWLFDEVVKPVVEGLKGKTGPYRLKMIDARSQTETRDFMCSISEGIAESGFFIVDLSEQNANVYLELGLMLAQCQRDIRRRFVLISSFAEPLKADIASINVVRYSWEDLEAFSKKLESACLDTFKRAAPAPASLPVTMPYASSSRPAFDFSRFSTPEPFGTPEPDYSALKDLLLGGQSRNSQSFPVGGPCPVTADTFFGGARPLRAPPLFSPAHAVTVAEAIQPRRRCARDRCISFAEVQEAVSLLPGSLRGVHSATPS